MSGLVETKPRIGFSATFRQLLLRKLKYSSGLTHIKMYKTSQLHNIFKVRRVSVKCMLSAEKKLLFLSTVSNNSPSVSKRSKMPVFVLNSRPLLLL